MRIKLSQDIVGRIYFKYKCQCANCGENQNLHIHHVDFNRNNNDEENLILLCKDCHKFIHSKMGKRRYYNEEQISEYIEKEDIDDYETYLFDWIVESDDTDHIVIKCPKCKEHAVIYKIYTWNDGKNGFDICPCLFIKLKCGKCKIKGQRKIYTSYKLLDKCNKRWRNKNVE
jgi:phage FluMu protein Com